MGKKIAPKAVAVSKLVVPKIKVDRKARAERKAAKKAARIAAGKVVPRGITRFNARRNQNLHGKYEARVAAQEQGISPQL